VNIDRRYRSNPQDDAVKAGGKMIHPRLLPELAEECRMAITTDPCIFRASA
jgi:hypothetical protein